MTLEYQAPVRIREACRRAPRQDLTFDIGPSAISQTRRFFGQAGPVQIELIQVKGSDPNIHSDRAAGKEAYHHLAYFADDLDAEVARFEAMGVEVGTRASFGTVQYAYFETNELIASMTEVLQHDAGLEPLFKTIAEASIDWGGSDPVRLVSKWSSNFDPAVVAAMDGRGLCKVAADTSSATGNLVLLALVTSYVVMQKPGTSTEERLTPGHVAVRQRGQL